MSGPLPNPRHERFAQELAKGKVADDAAEVAGLKSRTGYCGRLAASVDVVRRVAELSALAAEVTVTTSAGLIRLAEEARKLAMELKQPAAAVTAIHAMAKLAGVWIDKRENTNRNVDQLTDDELAEYLTTNGSAHHLEAKADQGKLN